MDSPEPALDPQTLLADAGWLRGLARSLVSDPGRADDVAQETWVAALERAPRPRGERGIRDWLAAVARNLARREHQREAQRPSIEHLAARDEAVAGGQESVERMQLQRDLADAILALDEPYRSAVILRHLDGLAPAEIAQRQRCTSEAARQRVARGLKKLRVELDRRAGGDRGAWVQALVHVCGLPTPATPLGATALTAGIVGGTLMSMKAVLLVIAGSLGVAAFAWLQDGGSSPTAHETTQVAAPAKKQDREVGDRPVAGLTPPADPRGAGPSTTVGPAEAQRVVAADPSRATLRGRVVDTGGVPVEGATVALRVSDDEASSPLASGSSLATGEFEIRTTSRVLAREQDQFMLVAERDGYLRALRLLNPGEEAPIELVVTRRPLVSGHVLDPEGHRVGSPGLVQLTVRDASGDELEFETEIQDDGSWICTDLVPGELVRTWARAKGYAEGVSDLALPLPPGADETLDLSVEGGATVRGFVVDEDTGEPIPFADVWAEAFFHSPDSHEPTTQADAKGAFELRGVHAHTDVQGLPEDHVWIQMAARAPGYSGKALEPHVAKPEEDGSYELVIRCLAAGAAVKGRVLHADGTPASGAALYSVDSRNNLKVLSTDEDGWFQLEELPEGTLALCAFLNEDGAVIARAQAQLDLEHGLEEAVEIVLAEEGTAVIGGRVVGLDGAPLEGEHVNLGHHFVASEGFTIGLGESNTTTDARGVFRFEALLPGRYQATLTLDEDSTRRSIGTTSVVLGAGEDFDEIELVVAEAVRIAGWVDLGSHTADAFTIELRGKDGDGYGRTSPATDGSFAFDDRFPRPYEVVLLRDGKAVDRRAVEAGNAPDVVLVATD